MIRQPGRAWRGVFGKCRITDGMHTRRDQIMLLRLELEEYRHSRKMNISAYHLTNC